MSNATVTVTYGDESVTFELDGIELSQGWNAEGDEVVPSHFYLNNASRGFIGDQVEQALLKVVAARMDANASKVDTL